VLATERVRVYHDRLGRPRACLRRSGRVLALDRGVDPYYARRYARLQRVRLAGGMLGYTWFDPGVPIVHVHSLDLRRGRFVHRTSVRPPTRFEPTAVAVPDLVVRPSGAIAWAQVVEDERSVWRFDARGRRRLDAHARIDLRSVGLAGVRVTWRRAGRLRSATLR
jgi:hypothetical protein